MDKETLNRLYLIEGKTQQEIATLLGFCEGSITVALRKYGLRKTPKTKGLEKPPREWLVKEYENGNVQKIAEQCKVVKSTVYRWLDEYQIPRIIKDVSVIPELTDVQKDIIIGSLLGDGYITYNKKYQSCAFSKTQAKPLRFPDRLEYLQWHYKMLEPYSVSLCNRVSYDCKILDHKNIERTEAHVFKTHCQQSFIDLENKWYLRDCEGNRVLKNNRRVKIVPDDLILKPLSAAIWYCDDGCNNIKGGRLDLCTNGFSNDDREILIKCLFRDFNVNAYQYRGMIKITKDRHDFIDIIKDEFQWSCFDYKLKVGDRPKGITGENNHWAKLSNKDVDRLIEMSNTGLKHRELAEKFDVSRSYISSLLRGKVRKHTGVKLDNDLSLRNTSGCSGVYPTAAGRWEVKFMVKGKTIRLGNYDTKEEAVKVRQGYVR